jgi:hypothetical protein
MQKLLPKTEQYLNHMEELYSKYAANNWDTYDSASDEDKGIIAHPMLHLAETVYMEDPEWAEDLAKYLCVLCDIKQIGVKINVE